MATKESNNDKAIARKLHRQFAHPTSERLIRLIRNTGKKNKNLEKEIHHASKYCITCVRFKNLPLDLLCAYQWQKNSMKWLLWT